MKYTRTPQPEDTVEAIQWNGTNYDEIKSFFGRNLTTPSTEKGWEGMIILELPESIYGYKQLHIGSWLVKRIDGVFSTMENEAFAKNYGA